MFEKSSNVRRIVPRKSLILKQSSIVRIVPTKKVLSEI